jgi:hypothetical protein
MWAMPDMTNISDFDPATGRTTTTLVSTHNRGAQEEAARDGQSHDTWHRDDAAPAAGDPQISALSPNTVSAAAAATVVTVTGTNFVSGSVIEINQVAVPTTFVSATSLTTSYDPSVAGTVAFSVRNPNGEESNSVGFTVTASTVVSDPAAYTIDEIKEWVDDHAADADEVLAAENARGGDARSTLVTWLEGFIAHRDED